MKHSLIWVFAVCKCSLLGIICENIHSLHLKRKKNELCTPYHARIREFSSGENVCVWRGGVPGPSVTKKLWRRSFFLFNLIILVLN